MVEAVILGADLLVLTEPVENRAHRYHLLNPQKQLHIPHPKDFRCSGGVDSQSEDSRVSH